MTRIIGAPTLYDALKILTREIGAREERGEKNIVFCEDRLTLLAERAVIEESGGTFLTEVTTFARFLSDKRKVLSKQGSVMKLSSILEEAKGELYCFSPDAAGAAYETIAQLSASRVGSDMLRRSAEAAEGMLKHKLLDLALISERYEAYLSENGLLDENGYLALLPARMEQEIAGVNAFFFAFPSFTAQAREGVRAAIANAASVTGIFIAGREEGYTNEGARIFRRVAEEFGETRPSMVKCTLEGDALSLQRSLFAPERFSLPPEPSRQVHIFSAANEAEELSKVAALIRKYVAEGVRFREIAVLVADDAGFSAAEKAFAAFKIPYFADKKRKFSAHPFCVYALACLSAASTGLPADIDDVLACVCFGESGNYRNYLLKFGGYRGGYRREIKDGDAIKGYDRAELIACREKLLNALALFPRRATGREYAAAVAQLLERSGWEDTRELIGANATAEEREFLDASPLSGVLDEICAVAGDRTFSAREFGTVLKNGLDALSVSMLPQSADAVFVGDATESRVTRVKVLFATGLTDALPRVSPDTAVITDGEIKRLRELQVEIEPAVSEVNARARESLKLNLCAFFQDLYLSYPKKSRGEETQKGEVVRYAENIFSPAPMPEIFPYDCCEREPAALRLLTLKDDFEQGRQYAGERFSSLAAALEARGEGERIRFLLGGGQKTQVGEAKELYFAGGSVSPTLLEGYFSCPYAGFAARGLRLREREERTVLDTDAGTFVHTVLEETAKELNRLRDEAACRAFARNAAETLIGSPRYAALSDTPAGRYTAERLKAECEEVAAACFRQLDRSAFRVRETEEGISLPELSIAGKADRIDEADDYVRVIDYKTGAVDDSATAYYTGRKLQLQLYLLAAARGKKAAGAFYFPAAENFHSADETAFRMSGFFSGEREVVTRMDKTLEEGDKSLLFEGGLTGKFTDKGMTQADFEAFLDYAALVCEGAREEMRAGNVAPSPYEGACGYCKFGSLCGFTGEARRERSVKCSDVVKIVKRRRGEE